MKMDNSGHETNNICGHVTQAPCCGNTLKSMAIFTVWVIASLLFCVLKDGSTGNIWTAFDFRSLTKDQGKNHPQEAEVKQAKLSGGLLPEGLDKNSSSNKEERHSRPVEFKHDHEFLGGLFPEGFDEKSCLSRNRNQSFWNRNKLQKHRPSSHLISRLRSYEAAHKRCGPLTKSFNRALDYLKPGENYSISPDDCKYVVWIARDGLGNRMISLVSSFLYALLSQKVLLVDPGSHISDLFCEPFPGTSWLIPSNFPPILNEFKSFHKNSPKSYGYIIRKKKKVNPPYAYLYLVHNNDDFDKRFFCDDDQKVLQVMPWIVIKSNMYYAPSLFLMPSFQEELSKMFPEKDTVFHFLGNYLFHPTNPIWKSITRYYDANFARTDEKVGIQIRIFKTNPDPFAKVLNQILACVIKENILPKIKDISSRKSNKTISVLMTSLSSNYSDAVKEMYTKHPTIQVHQPSNEVHQHSKNRFHNMKAWEEMYLLSLTDKLVTSSKSTFGYVAQSLGDLKPWILYRPEEYNPPNPACQRALSMDPCFQAPPMLACQTRKRVDTGKIAGYVRHCEDMNWNRGLKLFNNDDVP